MYTSYEVSAVDVNVVCPCRFPSASFPSVPSAPISWQFISGQSIRYSLPTSTHTGPYYTIAPPSITKHRTSLLERFCSFVLAPPFVRDFCCGCIATALPLGRKCALGHGRYIYPAIPWIYATSFRPPLHSSPPTSFYIHSNLVIFSPHLVLPLHHSPSLSPSPSLIKPPPFLAFALSPLRFRASLH